MKAGFRSVPTSDLPSLKGEEKRTSLALLVGETFTAMLPRQL
jgi:hypothetical protein